ncbi:MAG: tetraacyldisaccharide 4'-kinase [Thermodesulfobacteriota bacterium]
MFTRTTIEKILRSGENESLALKILLSPLFLLSLVYDAVTRARVFLYDKSLFHARKLPCRVISVGNITLGGTGKTPLTLYIGRLLKEMDYKTAILSRGYGGSGEGCSMVLSKGDGPLHGPDKSGDEPYMIASKLSGVFVLTGKNRFQSGSMACNMFNIDAAILDDGYQHLGLYRDLNILLISPKTLNGKGWLLPRGELRETLASMNRADLIVVKGKEDQHPGLLDRLKVIIERDRVFFFKYKPVSFINQRDGKKETLDFVKGKRLLTVCGIALPDSFVETLNDLGGLVYNKIIFPDHHHYTTTNIEHIKRSSSDVDIIVTTEKDGVKLSKIIPADLDIYMLEIDIEMSEEARFKEYLKNVLEESGNAGKLQKDTNKGPKLDRGRRTVHTSH